MPQVSESADRTAAFRVIRNLKIHVHVLSGPQAGLKFDPGHDAVIGSGEHADFRIADPLISREHLHISYRNPWWVVSDLNSTNGSFLDGHLIRTCPVFGGEILLIGNTRLRIESNPGAEQTSIVKRNGEWVQIPRIIAHELKNYLQFLDIGVEHLSGNSEICRNFKDDIQTLKMAKSNMDSLVQALRAGGVPPRFTDIDLRELVWEHLILVEPIADGLDVALYSEIPDSEIPVHADSHQLGRCFLNFIKNALEACSPGDSIFIDVVKSGKSVTIHIRDTGQGMDSETLESFWVPLFTTKPDGHGLGAFIARTIILRHSGNVTVQSTPGHGTLISITLPVAS